MSSASYPPKPCRQCGRGDANWIVSILGCGHCFDPFATASHIALLERVAEAAEGLVNERESLEGLGKVVKEWRENGAAFREGRRKSTLP